MARSYEQLDIMRSYYSKVTVILLQLHQATYTPSSRQLTNMLSKLKAKLQSHYGTKVGYFWVREQDKADSQHYHVAIMLNGHKCQRSKLVDIITQTYWENLHPDNFSFRVRNRIYHVRNDDDGRELRAIRMRLSYMAKREGKERFPSYTKAYGCSRLRAKHSH
uniref:YagK/YfjJ domain-containing protein n=1 Tax=Thaumasiovibrio subtropicus TaxID=1891207 RepID=UPI00131D66CF|nr:inovirus-type Gp2 protein [Thaumasiovibrio subtropicus]